MICFTRFIFIIVIFFGFFQGAPAQTAVALGASLKSHPEDFTHRGNGLDSFLHRDPQNRPIYQLDLGISRKPKRRKWAWHAAFSYRRTKRVIEYTGKNTFENAVVMHQLNFVGLKLGSAWHPMAGKRKRHGIAVSLGVQAHLPVGSKYTLDSDINYTTNIYRGSDVWKAFFYGIYLRPTYYFSFSRYRETRIKFGIYVEGDLLMQHKAWSNPKILYGGGLSATYEIR